MPAYLVETYIGRGDSRAAASAVERTEAAIAASVGSRVIQLRAVYVPDDEVLFQLYLATTADEVKAVLAAAGLLSLRVSPAVLLPDTVATDGR